MTPEERAEALKLANTLTQVGRHGRMSIRARSLLARLALTLAEENEKLTKERDGLVRSLEEWVQVVRWVEQCIHADSEPYEKPSEFALSFTVVREVNDLCLEAGQLADRALAAEAERDSLRARLAAAEERAGELASRVIEVQANNCYQDDSGVDGLTLCSCGKSTRGWADIVALASALSHEPEEKR